MTYFSPNSTYLVVPSVQLVPALDLPDIWHFKYLRYNAGLPLLACSIFFACSLIHLSMLVISKRFYMLPLVAGLLIQFLSQILKIICVISTSTPQALNYYVLYTLTTDLVPCLFLASIVWMIRRIMGASDPICFSRIVRVASQQILILEAVAFWLQAYGLLVHSNPILWSFWGTGNSVTLAGSAIELFNLTWVLVSLAIILRKQRSLTGSISEKRPSFNFRGLATVITISVTLIMIRTTSKFVFHFKNPNIEPFQNEVLTFTLQSLPLALCAAVLILFHPCRYDGDIPDEEHSFVSPGTPMFPALGNKIRASRCPSLNRTSNSSDPFCAVHITTAYSSSKLSNSHIPPIDESYIQSRRSLSSSNGYNLHPGYVINCEQAGVGWEIRQIDDAVRPDVFRISRNVKRGGTPEVNDLRVMRQNSPNYCEKNMPDGQECQNHSANSPTIQHDGFTLASYYDGSSRNSTKVGPHNLNHKKISRIASFCAESMYSGAEKI